MLKRFVIYPFLFVLYAIVSPLATNLGEIAPREVLRPLAALIFATMVSLLLCRWIFGDWHYAAYLTFLGLVFLVLYGHINRVLQNQFGIDTASARPYLLGAWSAILLALGIKKVWRKIGGKRVTGALNLYLGLVLLVQFFASAPGMVKAMALSSQPSEPLPVSSAAAPVTLDCTNHPDMYYIVMDAYGRSDVLKSVYGLDNTAFIRSLQSKGFYVANQSHSNYIQTIFSIPSALNLTYPASEPPGTDPVKYFTGLITDNELMSVLKQCGYKTIAFETGFSFTEDINADVYLASGSPFNDFESLLLADSPLDWLPGKIYQKPSAQSYEGHRERVSYTFKELMTAVPKMPGPKIVFAHIISPHPPFVFNAQGNPVQPSHSYVIADGDDYPGTWDEYQQGYAAQVQFVDRMLEKTIDAILAKSSSPPVIIIQGDHGPGGHLDWDSPSQSCLAERTAILNAYYLPGADAGTLWPDISPVNSFRVVLNAYFDANLDLLPDKTYFTSHRLPRQIIDITDLRNSTLNCP